MLLEFMESCFRMGPPKIDTVDKLLYLKLKFTGTVSSQDSPLRELAHERTSLLSRGALRKKLCKEMFPQELTIL